MLIMKKVSRLLYLILVLAFIIHVVLLLFLFSVKYAAIKKNQTKQTKLITFEKTAINDLPTMLPGKLATSIDQVLPKELVKGVVNNEIHPSETNNVVLSSTMLNKKSPKKGTKAIAPPLFNFDQLNHYALAEGNSAFKNQGVNRPPQKEDFALLTYQEKIRKHFGQNWNRYADQTYFYNLELANIHVAFTISKDGRVIEIKTKDFSNNPAIPKLIEKILRYAEPFPKIPELLKIECFTLRHYIAINKGKFSSGYRWQ